jgi:ABC-type Zn uptake system ZnuABC Zn-binding protein ZnuA
MNIRTSIIAAVAATFLTGSTGNAQSKLNVVTSTEDLASIAREVGGDKVAITALAKGIRTRISSIRNRASFWR